MCRINFAMCPLSQQTIQTKNKEQEERIFNPDFFISVEFVREKLTFPQRLAPVAKPETQILSKHRKNSETVLVKEL